MDVGPDEESVDEGLTVEWIGQVAGGVVFEGCGDLGLGGDVFHGGFGGGDPGGKALLVRL